MGRLKVRGWKGGAIAILLTLALMLLYQCISPALPPVNSSQAVVAGQPFLMQDGTLLYVAVADVYVNNNQRLEGKGVTPDVIVPFSPAYAQGADPQKERAIAIAVDLLK